MQTRSLQYLMKNVRNIFYLVVLYGYSFCHAGSYDDFFSAIKRDDAGAVSTLLGRGFDANTRSPAGDHGLLVALREPSLKVVAVLINWPQTTIEARTAQDESPLMLAALKGLTEICQQLIARGADVNKPGWAPLHYAATHGRVVGGKRWFRFGRREHQGPKPARVSRRNRRGRGIRNGSPIFIIRR